MEGWARTRQDKTRSERKLYERPRWWCWYWGGRKKGEKARQDSKWDVLPVSLFLGNREMKRQRGDEGVTDKQRQTEREREKATRERERDGRQRNEMMVERDVVKMGDMCGI
jgi:hypothetical protein